MIDWAEVFEAGRQPKYQRLSEHIAAAIHEGRLAPGTRLPSHRDLAYQLGISIGSVARAYGELVEQRLVRGEVGRGTIVQRPEASGWIGLKRGPGVADLGLVVRPSIDDEALIDEAGRKTLRALGNQWPLLSLGEFPAERGDARHRKAAETWLGQQDVPTGDDTVAIMIGAQEALACSLMSIAQRGETVLVESETFASLRDLADTLGLQLCAVAMDQQGMLPEDLRRRARQRRAKVLVVQPTLQIPTTASMGADRRQQIADIVRKEALTAIEYEGWSSVITSLGPPLARLAPERVVYIDAVSNALMPGLRTSIVRVPEQLMPSVLATRHAMLLSTPSLLSEVVTHWIMNGIAARLADAVAQKNARRMRLARRLLGSRLNGAPESTPFIWLPVAPFNDVYSFVRAAENRGVKVLPAERFSVGQDVPARVRVALSSANSDEELETALGTLARLCKEGT